MSDDARSSAYVHNAGYGRAQELAHELGLPTNATRAQLTAAWNRQRYIVATMREGFDDSRDLEDVLDRLPVGGLSSPPWPGWVIVAPEVPGQKPVYHIRVVAVLCANGDGSLADSLSPAALTTLFQGLTNFYLPAGLTFSFRTVAVHSTILNQDFTMPAGADLTAPTAPITKAQLDASFNEHNAARSTWARQFRGELVVFFRYGTSVKWNDTAKVWTVGKATGAFSGPEHEFAAMNQGTEMLLLAHELGHYFHLSHTHPSIVSLTDAEKLDFPNPDTNPADSEGRRLILRGRFIKAIRSYVDDQGHPPEQGLNVFNADGLADTPADPGPDFIRYELGSKCAPGPVTVEVPLASGPRHYTVDPDRNIVMSYFFRCPGAQRFTPLEIDRLRNSLEQTTFTGITLSRHHLIVPRLSTHDPSPITTWPNHP